MELNDEPFDSKEFLRTHPKVEESIQNIIQLLKESGVTYTDYLPPEKLIDLIRAEHLKSK